jgi:hypothetical protein
VEHLRINGQERPLATVRALPSRPSHPHRARPRTHAHAPTPAPCHGPTAVCGEAAARCADQNGCPLITGRGGIVIVARGAVWEISPFWTLHMPNAASAAASSRSPSTASRRHSLSISTRAVITCPGDGSAGRLCHDIESRCLAPSVHNDPMGPPTSMGQGRETVRVLRAL